MRERLFEPLGMTSRGFGALAGAGQSWGHESAAKTLAPIVADNPSGAAAQGAVGAALRTVGPLP